jgi:hypothetical protein
VSFCVAVDWAGNVLTSSDPTGGAKAWTITDVDGPNNQPVSDRPTLADISCPALSLCVTVDAVGNVIVGTHPTAANNRDANVDGYVRLCGGPVPGRCYIDTIGFCGESDGCVTSDSVVAIDPRGRRVAEQTLHHARFHMRLAPGAYTLELLGDGKRVHGRVMQRKKITARAHHTTVVRFFFAIY